MELCLCGSLTGVGEENRTPGGKETASHCPWKSLQRDQIQLWSLVRHQFLQQVDQLEGIPFCHPVCLWEQWPGTILRLNLCFWPKDPEDLTSQNNQESRNLNLTCHRFRTRGNCKAWAGSTLTSQSVLVAGSVPHFNILFSTHSSSFICATTFIVAQCTHYFSVTVIEYPDKRQLKVGGEGLTYSTRGVMVHCCRGGMTAGAWIWSITCHPHTGSRKMWEQKEPGSKNSKPDLVLYLLQQGYTS